MELYVIRHGQTDWNVNSKIQGQKDIVLNTKGIQQANMAREIFNDLNVDLIICSPLKRTRKTAEIINQEKNVKIIYRNELMERGLGKFEGQDCGSEERDIYNYYKNKNSNDIEPVVDLCNRVNTLLEEIKKDFSKNTILLVTHGGTIRAIEAYFYGIDINGELPPENIKNCEIRKYKL